MKIPVAIVSTIAFLILISFSFALVNKNLEWLPVQQIATTPESDISLDENYNGIVDNADALNGYKASDFLMKKGGVLKGYLYLYYGVGKIMDMDNLNYYIDPSASSRFNVLCLNDKCIKRFSEIAIDTSALENRISSLEQWCIEGKCSQGINARLLQNHTIGQKEGNIPIINSSIIYKNLKVGYSLEASYLEGKNASYFQPLLNQQCKEGFITGFENGKIVCASLQTNNLEIIALNESLEKINNTLLNYIIFTETAIESIQEQIKNTNMNIINNYTALDTKYTNKINEIKNNYATKSDINQISSKLSNYVTKNEFNVIKQQIISLQSLERNIANKIKEQLAAFKCQSGLLKGFDSNGNAICESQSTIANNIRPFLQLSQYATKTDLNNVKQQITTLQQNINTQVTSQVKNTIKTHLSNKRCYSGLVKGFDSNANIECKSYSEIANALNSYMLPTLKNQLSYTFVSKQELTTKLSQYIKKSSLPYCGTNQYLIVNNGVLQCKSLPNYRVTFNYETIRYDSNYKDEGTFTLKCPEGYVMTGIKIKREEEDGISGGHAFIRQINLLCKKAQITSY